MKRIPTGMFVALALALAIGLATAVSPFASPSPDGLEKVAEDKAFLDEGKLARHPGGLADPRLRVPGHRERAGGHRRWPASSARSACSRSASGSPGSCCGAPSRRRPARSAGLSDGEPVGALCNHSLELTGLAGDPASPVHRLDPRAKIVGLVAVTLVAVSTPLAAWPVFVACAARARRRRAAGARVGRATSGGGRASSCRWCCSRRVFLPFVRNGRQSWSRRPAHRPRGRARDVRARWRPRRRSARVSAVLLGATTTFPVRSCAGSRRCACRACSS